ncbi:hypothetical protein [Halobaculum sp. P14]|uniref:hypothetical protein n=1 Tax=Halobaculum sp. P14 TaxID=3421638 RepID=UPI003EBB3954
MQRRRLAAYARLGVAYPAATVVAVAAASWAAGVDVGVAVLGLSTLSAAVLTGAFLADTRTLRSDEANRGPDQHRGFLGGNSESGASAVPRGIRARLATYAAGLFVQTATLVVVLGRNGF